MDWARILFFAAVAGMFCGMILFCFKMMCYDLYDPSGELSQKRARELVEQIRSDVSNKHVKIYMDHYKWVCENYLTRKTGKSSDYVTAYKKTW